MNAVGIAVEVCELLLPVDRPIRPKKHRFYFASSIHQLSNHPMIRFQTHPSSYSPFGPHCSHPLAALEALEACCQ